MSRSAGRPASPQILMLAHQIREAIEEGHYANATVAAATWNLSRNRMSQVLMLNLPGPRHPARGAGPRGS
jgi:hypothetical protein